MVDTPDNTNRAETPTIEEDVNQSVEEVIETEEIQTPYEEARASAGEILTPDEEAQALAAETSTVREEAQDSVAETSTVREEAQASAGEVPTSDEIVASQHEEVLASDEEIEKANEEDAPRTAVADVAQERAEARRMSRRQARKSKKKKKSALFRVFRSIFIFLFVVTALFVGITYAIVYMGTERYPVDYQTEIMREAAEQNADPYLIMAIVKTESDFRPNVVSNDGAMGLMQLLPETGEWVANRLGVPFVKEDLNDPSTNIKYGTYYINYLIGYFQNVDLAIIAYNTGFNNVDQWLKDGTITREPETFSHIPYNEPRRYVEKVERALRVYRMFYADGFPEGEQKDSKFAIAWDNWIDVFRWVQEGF